MVFLTPSRSPLLQQSYLVDTQSMCLFRHKLTQTQWGLAATTDITTYIKQASLRRETQKSAPKIIEEGVDT